MSILFGTIGLLLVMISFTRRKLYQLYFLNMVGSLFLTGYALITPNLIFAILEGMIIMACYAKVIEYREESSSRSCINQFLRGEKGCID